MYNIQIMEYTQREIVWAKPTGYPWWPAHISKLPENNDGNFKVVFIGEDNFAILDPKSIRKYEQNYEQLSKSKPKKLQAAISKADIMLKNRKNNEPKNKKQAKAKKIEKKKNQKKQEQQVNNRVPNNNQSLYNKKQKQSKLHNLSNRKNEDADNYSSEDQQSSHNDLEKRKQLSLTPLGLSDQLSIQRQIPEINKQKIQKIESRLNDIVIQFQKNRIKKWQHQDYFNDFDCEYLTCEQILQSNITRMIKYIIYKMEQLNFCKTEIDQLKTISQNLKTRIYEYLSNTSYYDQYLRVFDKNKQNQAEAELIIVKIIKKFKNCFIASPNTPHSKIKKQNIQLFAELIGQQIGKGGTFRATEFIQDLKENKHDIQTKLTSKAATQRFSQSVIKDYI